MGKFLGIALSIAAAIGLAVFAVDRLGTSLPSSASCVARVGQTEAEVDLEQAKWAALIAAMGAERELSARATTIAIATAFQESKLRNIDYGDRDSVGLFQQRPSQGWGSVDQIMDPHYSIGRFYDALVKVEGYEEMEITDAAQAVQRSGFPTAYAQHEADARALASSLRGYSPAAFSCTIEAPEDGDLDGLVEWLDSAWGSVGVETSDEGSASIPLTGEEADIDTRGWALAQFIVANAAEFGVSTVSFDDMRWTAGSDEGWVPEDGESRTAVTFSVA